MTTSQATQNLVRHLASRPGHDEVKADFRQLLIEEFGVELHALDFERRVPEVHGRLDALIGRTVFEAKTDLDREWHDIERRMPDYQPTVNAKRASLSSASVQTVRNGWSSS
jgi:hypothetical protein